MREAIRNVENSSVHRTRALLIHITSTILPLLLYIDITSSKIEPGLDSESFYQLGKQVFKGYEANKI